jgi:hypothetical protein
MHTTDPNLSRRYREKSRWRRLVLLGGVVLLGGCRTNPRYDLLEAELRTRERELAEARSDLRSSRDLNRAYQQTPRGIVNGETGMPFQPLKEVILGSGTGGADNDSQPGDESLQVVLVPRDEDNSAVKVPANVVVLAYEVARNGTKTPIGRWDVCADQLRKTWRGGLFATGYYLLLQWDQVPAYEKVRIAVRVQTLDGRVFEADKDVTVRVLPGTVPGARDVQPLLGEGAPLIPPALIPNVPPPSLPPDTVPTNPPRIEELPPPRESRASPVRLAPARPK